MKPTFCLFMWLLLCVSTLSAQRLLYIEKVDGCYEEFMYQDSDGNTMEALSQINGNKDRVIYQLSDKAETRYRAPGSMTSCKNVRMTEALVNSVRTGATKLYFVKKSPTGRGFQIFQVDNVIEMAFTDEFMEYKDKNVDFTYDFRPAKSSVNLANPKSGSRVYFDDAVNYNCPRQFRFKQVFDKAGRDYQYITVAEDVGLISTAQPPRPPVTVESKNKLVNVNGKALKKYFQDVCSGNVGIANGGSTNNETSSGGSSSANSDPWEKEGHGRIYRDLNSGLYIDRKTWTAANMEYGGYLYVNGKQYAPDDPNAPSLAGGTNRPGEQARGNCSFYYDQNLQLFMDRVTALPAEGLCNGMTYQNGRLINTGGTNPMVPSTPSGTGSGDCFVYLSPNGIYVDGRTGQAATTVCDGKSYVNGRLMAGQPNGGTATPPGAPVVVEQRHTVKKGETLYSISRRYGLSVAQLQSWNNLSSSSNLFPGQKLRVSPPGQPAPASYDYYNRSQRTPSSSIDPIYGYEQPKGLQPAEYGMPLSNGSRPTYGYHTVQKGETLPGIARSYSMSEKQIRDLNNMSDWEIIFPGQQLRVITSKDGSKSPYKELPDVFDADNGRVVVKANPKGSTNTAKVETYTVKKGDTLSKISKSNAISVTQLKSLNGLKSNTIFPGQKLRVK